jgi:Chromo (CHRromatin Organisation MOdifier) domain
MAKLASELHVTHRFSSAYTPRANGTVESVCKQILRASRALQADFMLQPDDWARVLPLIQSVLNNSASDRLGGHTPMMAFTGHQVSDPVSLALTDNIVVPANYDVFKAQQSVKVADLQQVAGIHKEVAESSTRSRRQKIEAHNRKTHIKSTNFAVGDYVLVAVPKKERRHKLTAVWRGPRSIVRLDSSSTFGVENIVKCRRSIVHFSHLVLYSDSSRGQEVEREKVAEHLEREVFTIRKFLDLRFNHDDLRHEALCAWRGYADSEATWESIDVLKIDIPAFLQNFLDQFADQELVAWVRAE